MSQGAIAVLAAMPAELRPLVHGWKRLPTPPGIHLWTNTAPDGRVHFAACAGMGGGAVARAFEAVSEAGDVALLISTGFVGATTQNLVPGRACWVREVVDTATGEHYAALPVADGGECLATTAQPADAAEKARLLASYGATVVDMEAATVARLAAMRAIRFACVKAVSDGPDAQLPPLEPFVDARGQLHVLPFVLHVALRPRWWPILMRFALDSRKAAAALAIALRSFLQQAP